MDVYLAHTPYHLILCILNGCLEQESTVVLLDDSGNLSWYGRNEVVSFFHQRLVYLSLGGKNSIEKLFNKNTLFSRITNSPINTLTNHIKNLKPNRVYVFADYQPEVQCILRQLGNAHITYIEDGSAPYNLHELKNQKNFIFQKILFGLHYERISVFGTSKFIRDSLFTFPELIREENRKTPYRKIRTGDNSALKRFSELYEIEKNILEETRDISIYLVPPYIDEYLLTAYRQSIQKDLENDVRPIIKHHPSSKIIKTPLDDCWEIDQFIPTELLLLSLKNVKRIFSYPSTSLLVAGLFRKIEAYCFIRNTGETDHFYINNLRSVGVNLIWLK